MKFEIFETEKRGRDDTFLGEKRTPGVRVWRWRLRTEKGSVIVCSEDYLSKEECEHVVRLVMATSSDTPVVYL